MKQICLTGMYMYYHMCAVFVSSLQATFLTVQCRMLQVFTTDRPFSTTLSLANMIGFFGRIFEPHLSVTSDYSPTGNDNLAIKLNTHK